MTDEVINTINWGECGDPRAVCETFGGCHFCCPEDYKTEIDDDGDIHYIRITKAENTVTYIHCGNCSVLRRMTDGHLVDECKNCGDDEYDLSYIDDLPF